MGESVKSLIQEIASYAAFRHFEELTEFQCTGRKEWPRLTIIATDVVPKDRLLFMYGRECVGQIKGIANE